MTLGSRLVSEGGTAVEASRSEDEEGRNCL